MKVTLSICASFAILAVAHAAPQPDFSSARTAAAALPQLHSLLVSHNGRLRLEHYAPRHSATRLANIKSASKSLISALVGIAIERKLIAGLDEPIVRWFPELRKDGDRRKNAITIENLLTMRSGLESTSGQNYGRWVTSRNWVRHALERPMVSDPGTSMEYSTGTSHILSAILTKVAGKSTHAFATEVLAQPLGMTLARWPRDPQGIYFGGNEMLMTPRQMVTFGELYLNRGRAAGRQIVPAEWVDTSCVPRTGSRWDRDREYGSIRDLFTQTPLAVDGDYKPGRFSFNVKGGRCEECQGEGVITTQLYFMPDVEVTCGACKGARFNAETLEVTLRGKTIDDVLNMSVEEGVAVFASEPAVRRMIQVLADLGLGYLTLGQSATTLSGGEAPTPRELEFGDWPLAFGVGPLAFGRWEEPTSNGRAVAGAARPSHHGGLTSSDRLQRRPGSPASGHGWLRPAPPAS